MQERGLHKILDGLQAIYLEVKDIFKKYPHHPIKISRLKSNLFKGKLYLIIFIFIAIYLLWSVLFATAYCSICNESSPQHDCFQHACKFSISRSFGLLNSDLKLKTNSSLFIYIICAHKITILISSALFTASLVLHFFLMPDIFVFKDKINMAL